MTGLEKGWGLEYLHDKSQEYMLVWIMGISALSPHNLWDKLSKGWGRVTKQSENDPDTSKQLPLPHPLPQPLPHLHIQNWNKILLQTHMTLRKNNICNKSQLYLILIICCSIAQSCLTLCDPMDSSMPGFSI